MDRERSRGTHRLGILGSGFRGKQIKGAVNLESGWERVPDESRDNLGV